MYIYTYICIYVYVDMYIYRTMTRRCKKWSTLSTSARSPPPPLDNLQSLRFKAPLVLDKASDLKPPW